MHQVRKLIAQIRAALGDAPPPTPLEPLALEYARWREDAAHRLASCAGMLAKGSEHSALELAEAQPPLLDLVAELSFAEEPQWQSLCARNDLPTGPLFDTRTIAALDAVYAKGISSNSPLYQDYRSAVTARDDVKALHIIRTIARVNPSDNNAQSELERLRNKFMHAKMETLRGTLAANDDNAAADLVDELEELATKEKLETQPDFPRGLAVRKRVRLAQATRELPALLEEMERLQHAGDWHRAAERLSFLAEQERELGLTPDSTQAARRDAVQRYVQDRRTDAAEQAKFLQAVEKLRVYGEQSATRAAGASTLTLAEALELQAKFDQLEHEVTQFRRTVPEPAAGSIRASRRAVHGAVASIRRGIAMRRMAVVAVAVLIIGAIAAYFIRSALVKSYHDKLVDFQKNGQALAAQELLKDIEAHNILGIHSAPDLQAAMADTGRWVAGQEDLRNQAQAQITVLEKDDPATADTAEIHERLGAVTKLTGTLAPDMAPPLKERIAAVQRKFDAHIAKMREASNATWQSTLTEVQKLLGPVSFQTPSATVQPVLTQVAPMLQSLEKDVSHPVPALRPDPTQVETFEALVKKEADLRTEISSLTAARAALDKADSLDAYDSALKTYAAIRFAEATTAQIALKEFPTADDPPARLLMGGDRDAWRSVKVAASANMRPSNVRQEEVALLLALRDDPDLKEVWQWTVLNEGNVQTGFSRGQLREYIVGGEKRYSGKLWVPKEKDLTPVFTEVKLTRTGGPLILSNFSLCTTSQLLGNLKLQELTDANGVQWTRSAFEVIRDLVRAPVGSPTARAILLQHLGALTALRPYEWGRHCCPSLRRDLAELDSICGGRRLNTFEWMLPNTINELEDKLTAFFGRISNRDYLDEARRFRDVALAVHHAGVRYAGFVDGEGNAHILQDSRAASELWCLGGENPILLRVTAGAPNAGVGSQSKTCRPFSPLFHVPLNRSALLQQMKVTDASIPFLNAP